MRSARSAGPGFSPLDEELQLLAGGLSATVLEGLVRLATWMPFAQAAEHLAFFWQVSVEASTVRRQTEAAGAAYVTLQTAEVERLERAALAAEPVGDRPNAGPVGPAVLQVSADGALVPLLHGEWAEVKTVALGRVERGRAGDPEGVPQARAHDLSYFSRLADAETFTRLAWGELHRRGLETAGTVCGVMDGADWEQTFLDVHRPDAKRILDFPHSIEHLTTAGQATLGVGTAATTAWRDEQAHALKHDAEGPAAVLAALAALPVAQAADPTAASSARDATLGYLTKRLEQIQYAHFQALGYPIGSGAVESANKLVVEARLKGSGMHWAREHVNPMLALRTIACADQWAEAWPQITATLRQQAQQRRHQRRRARRPPPVSASAPPPPPLPEAALPARRPATAPRRPRVVDGRPTAEHPWRRPLLAGGRRYTASHPRSL